VDIRFSGILHFPSEVIAEFTCGFTTEHRGLEAIGTKGALVVPDPWHSKPQTILRDGEPLEVEPADPYQLELDNMAAAIRGERAPLLGRADALGQSRTIAALYASAASGAGVRP
jgi:D-xylose 1-dehydrogenase (NADP+, D-xylono-1,5-lactone-forming)